MTEYWDLRSAGFITQTLGMVLMIASIGVAYIQVEVLGILPALLLAVGGLTSGLLIYVVCAGMLVLADLAEAMESRS